jgi:putative transposase
MPNPPPLQPGQVYHFYNRGNNGEDLFREERNYAYFLKLCAMHILPVADTFAYCLMRNHFHLMVRIKSDDARERSRGLEPLERSLDRGPTAS